MADVIGGHVAVKSQDLGIGEEELQVFVGPFGPKAKLQKIVAAAGALIAAGGNLIAAVVTAEHSIPFMVV
jgi:hypothetical protein